MSEKTGSRERADGAWIRAPLWDLALLGFSWLPFYLWFVLGLGLDGTWVASGGAGTPEALALAAAVALAITYVHRHYTFILVYGDRDTFRQGARDFVLAPVMVFACVAGLRLAHASIDGAVVVAGVRLRPWAIVLLTAGAWNLWHTLMQRYGLLRVYAGRAGGGLEARAHGRRDLALMWALVAVVAVAAAVLRPETLAGTPNGRRLMRLTAGLDGPYGASLLAAVAVAAAVVARRWARHEFASTGPARRRIPRLAFWGSTVCLLLVFVAHGPIVGYLCFGVAHALEYIAFVHHFGERKFARSGRGIAARLLRRPLLHAPLVIGLLLALFVLLGDHRRTHVYLVYYFGTSLLHFLFDGWIWKVRRPQLRRPLGIGAPGGPY